MVTDRGTADGNEERVGKDNGKPITYFFLQWSGQRFPLEIS